MMIIISIVISIKILQDLFLKAICRCLCIHLSVDIVKIRAQGNIVFVNQDYMSINIKIKDYLLYDRQIDSLRQRTYFDYTIIIRYSVENQTAPK